MKNKSSILLLVCTLVIHSCGSGESGGQAVTAGVGPQAAAEQRRKTLDCLEDKLGFIEKGYQGQEEFFNSVREDLNECEFNKNALALYMKTVRTNHPNFLQIE